MTQQNFLEIIIALQLRPRILKFPCKHVSNFSLTLKIVKCHNITSVQGWPGPYIYGVCTVFLAGKLPNIRSYTVHIYGSGQPYMCFLGALCMQQQNSPRLPRVPCEADVTDEFFIPGITALQVYCKNNEFPCKSVSGHTARHRNKTSVSQLLSASSNRYIRPSLPSLPYKASASVNFHRYIIRKLHSISLVPSGCVVLKKYGGVLWCPVSTMARFSYKKQLKLKRGGRWKAQHNKSCSTAFLVARIRMPLLER